LSWREANATGAMAPRGVGLHEAGAQATVVGVVADGGVDVEVEGAARAREASRRGLHDGSRMASKAETASDGMTPPFHGELGRVRR
jgi:hypothetical protein